MITRRSWLKLMSLTLAGAPVIGSNGAANILRRNSFDSPLTLSPQNYYRYFTIFAEQERAVLGAQPQLPWQWFVDNIPFVDVPDKEIEQTYYFRWYSFQKHIRQTASGTVIDEFLDDVPWAGKFNSISAATGHHLREARWLRNQNYAESYAAFWFKPGSEPRRYSFWAADSVYAVYLATGNTVFMLKLFPKLIENYEAWECSNQDASGLFHQIDDRDGMEKSISGSGYRPSINSYMHGDAIAIARMASLANNPEVQRQYERKAMELRSLIEKCLWNPQDQFFETVKRAMPGSWANTRELIGYIPWYFEVPDHRFDVAWKQIFDPEGFAGNYGPTTAERRSPRYRFRDQHECLWNGPSWPFATTQTLVAMANLLQDDAQSVLTTDDYYRLFAIYTRSHRLTLQGSEQVRWIDEDLDPDTGEWIARDILAAHHQLPSNRGRYYNHSGYADLLITGLIGLRPMSGNEVLVRPLLASGKWNYFAVDGIPYHGHLLTILYDRDGDRYHRGSGFQLLCDGHVIAHTTKLQALRVVLPAKPNSERRTLPTR